MFVGRICNFCPCQNNDHVFGASSQSLLVAQQLANAVGGAMSGAAAAAAAMNQPILIPFNAGGHLSGQQGLVLSLPATNLQSLVAAAAAGGIMTLPLHNLQGKPQKAC